MTILRGDVRRITYRNDDNHYAVFRLRPDEDVGATAAATASGSTDESTEVGPTPSSPHIPLAGAVTMDRDITVTGYFPSIAVGEWIELEGEWVDHPRFGRQFRATTYRKQTPMTKQGITKYLASGAVKGIGPKLAQRLVAKFGEKTLDVIATAPHRLTEVEGIGRAKKESIVSSFQDEEQTRETLVFLHGYGISPSTAAKIHRTYGADTVEKVQNNPYRLADDVFGIGFKTADDIAQQMGVGADSPQRAEAAVVHLLNEAGHEGHVFLPKEELLRRAQSLNTSQDIVALSLDALASRGQVVVEEVAGEQAVYPAWLHAAETEVARRLLAMGKGSDDADGYNGNNGPREGHGPVPVSMGFNDDVPARLSDEQAQAWLAVTRATTRLVVVTGGPGTGKTTTLRSIADELDKQRLRLELAAPTGRAAKRLQEATGRPARTIHRLLEFSGGEGQPARFQRNEQTPIPADVVIVDEASMVDLPLMYHLLRAIKPNGRLVLVGDADQLPSVGPGNVLRDVLSSPHVPKVALTQVFRQAEESHIVVNAHRVRAGQKPLSGGETSDFFFMPRDEPQETVALLVEVATRRLPQYLGCDPVDDVQVLATVRRGPLGVDNLNEQLQQALNPARPKEPSVKVGLHTFRPGDRVMQTKNDYDKMVFNGDIGRVARIDADRRQLWVAFPDRESGELVPYEGNDLSQLTLAYCISVHKSQGSEYPVVVMPVVHVMPALMHRNLLYTAITRAKSMMVLIGTEGALRSYVRRTKTDDRYTALGLRMGSAGDFNEKKAQVDGH